MVELLKLYNEIVDHIVTVYRGFEAYLDGVRTLRFNLIYLFKTNKFIQIAEEWMDYITKLDRLIEEALGNCAKNSFSTLYDRVHGSGTIEPSPLVRLNLDLRANKVCNL